MNPGTLINRPTLWEIISGEDFKSLAEIATLGDCAQIRSGGNLKPCSSDAEYCHADGIDSSYSFAGLNLVDVGRSDSLENQGFDVVSGQLLFEFGRLLQCYQQPVLFLHEAIK